VIYMNIILCTKQEKSYSIGRGLSMSTHVSKFVLCCFAALCIASTSQHPPFSQLGIVDRTGTVSGPIARQDDHCNAVLAPLPAYTSSVGRLQSAISAAARIWYDHIKSLLRELH